MVPLFNWLARGEKKGTSKIALAESLLAEGNALLRQGKWAEAVEKYDAAIATDSCNAGAQINLGYALKELGRRNSAKKSFERALQLNPGSEDACYFLAQLEEEEGKAETAIRHLRAALERKPNFIHAWQDLCRLEIQANRMDEAKSAALSGLDIDPNSAPLNFYLGNLCLQEKAYQAAVDNYKRALAHAGNFPEAHYNLGNALMGLKRHEEALASFEKALSLNPDDARALHSQGAALQNLKKLEEALLSYDKALRLDPDYPEVHHGRSVTLRDLDRLEEALASSEKALMLDPDCVDAHVNRGNVFMGLMRLNEALGSYDKALRLDPDCVDAYTNRGSVLMYFKQLDQAIASYDKALKLKPDLADAYWNKSLLLILMGQYLEGWALYEWRFKTDAVKDDCQAFKELAWRGQGDIRGKKLLIYAEQGYGDVIQFCRYVPEVRALGAEVLFEVQKPLMSLVSTLDCQMAVIEKGPPRPAFDACCPVMSLPYVFKTSLNTIPAKIPYLYCDRQKAQQWQEKIGKQQGRKIGLVWSGSERHKNDRNRSIPLEDLVSLIELPVEWHSLQTEYRQHDLEVLQQHPRIRQHQDELQDFSDTAALINCLDLVVTVDTATAHVAGALGKPVWILLPYSPDYRWMLDREDSPWYPTARLFRQPTIGDWHSVIALAKSLIQANL